MKTTKTLTTSPRSPSRIAMAALLLALAPSISFAQTTRTWSGVSGDNLWATGGNWNGGTAPASGGILTNYRLDILGGTGGGPADLSSTITLNYAAAQNTTTINNSNAGLIGLLIGSGVAGSMRVTGGHLIINNAALNAQGAGGSVVGNNQNAHLSIEGGAFTNTGNFFLHYSGGGSGTTHAALSVSGTGVATFDTLSFGRAASVSTAPRTAAINLNGGTLAANNIASHFTTDLHSESAINFNGGTLRARQENGTFIANNVNRATVLNVLNGGAVIDSNGFNIDIAGAFVNNGTGGLTKSGGGILTLAGVNTYVGDTTISAGTLDLTSTSESRFNIADASASNGFEGAGTVNFNGLFRLDTTGLTETTGTWNLVNVGTQTFGGTFGLSFMDNTAFSNNNDGTYSSGNYTFSTLSGDLVLIPEPGTLALVGIALGSLLLFRRKR